MALETFTLSDGTRVEVGEWICTPAGAMMRDPAKYERPLEFQGFRHVDPKVLDGITSGSLGIVPSQRASHLTGVTDWQFWGTGRMAW